MLELHCIKAHCMTRRCMLQEPDETVDGAVRQAASAPSQSSSAAAGSGAAVATAVESSPQEQAKTPDSVAGNVTQLGKRQLPDPLPQDGPAQRRELPSNSSAVPMDAEAGVVHDAGSAVSKQAAASKWEDDMINWSI